MAYQSTRHKLTRCGSGSRISEGLAVGFFLLGVLSTSFGCGEEFDPYSQVSELRVLAVGADKPSVGPGEASEFDVFAFEPGGAELSYQWSWCPFSTGAITAYECAVSEEEINEGLALAGFSLPPYDLGTSPTASLIYPDPPEVVPFLCSLLETDELPDFFNTPDCERGIPVTVKVVVSGGGQSITAVRTIEWLVSGDLPPNNNPTALSLSLLKTVDVGGANEAVEVLVDGSTQVDRGTEYTLRLDIADDSSEAFVREEPGSPPTQSAESLAVSWFVEEGELESERTGFFDGESTLEEAGENVWRTPTAEEFSASVIDVFLVLRDERGGVAWLSRQVQLSP
jgi:hypothetical protein